MWENHGTTVIARKPDEKFWERLGCCCADPQHLVAVWLLSPHNDQRLRELGVTDKQIRPHLDWVLKDTRYP